MACGASIFYFAGNKYLWKSPRLLPTHVFIAFGRPVPAEQTSPAWARRELLDLGEIAFNERPVLKRHLRHESVRALTKHPGVARGGPQCTLTCAQLYAVA